MFESLGLGQGKKKEPPETDVRAAIQMLSTSIEAINQRLSGTNLDDSFNASLKEFLPRVQKSLQYLGHETDKMQRNITEMNNSFYKFEKNIESIINSLKQNITQQNAKISDAIDKIDSTQNLTTRTVESSNTNFTKKLDQMINIHLQEIQLLREQNNEFVRRMTSLENYIKQLVEQKK